MSSAANKYSGPNRSNMPVFGTYGGSQATIRLEKSNPGLRRSTPDSEALASSDEELEHARHKVQNGNKPSVKPARRTFSLADHPSITRKPSITASGTYSPSNSNPATPAADSHAWPTMSPSSSAWSNAAAGYPWTGSIWTTDSRKEPPARLQEVHPSGSHDGIPFSIPLQPTIKTIRSQSYSFGQLDPAAIAAQAGTNNGANDIARTRAMGPHPTLQHRASRPGTLGSGEMGSLGRLREVDDDDEETLDVTQRNVDQAREIERLEMENARLRAEQRQRTMSSTAVLHSTQSFRNTQIRGAVPEESDQAIDDQDDGSAGPTSFAYRNPPGRRFSEQIANPDRQPLSPTDSRLSRWQSAGFGRLGDIPQSRRHSFAADVPPRHGSFGSQDAEDPNFYENTSHGYPSLDDPMYFKLDEKRRLEAEASVQQGLTYANSYNLSPYGGPGQSFVIVNFKCCRSDIFYIQEGTGFHVEVGDPVIVDADRGTDLGAVQHVNVSLEEAKRYKDYYAEEHYKLLMMFSQQTKNGGMNAVNPNGPPSRQSTVGGMGPQGHGHRDGHSDPKAKMIKRLAQAHEMQALKEKEGNEAKAKRICSQKVVEHGLNMEILDAEFQMDNKKLTFYYFADEYINFNALVTDLFKVYKTRIWMSAINPASFQTPTSSLGLTPAYGNVGVNAGMLEPARRTPFAASGPGMHGHYDNLQPDARSRGTMNAPYYATYQPQPAMGQRVTTNIAPYTQGMPPAIDPFSSYPAQNFGMFGPPAPGFNAGRPDPRPVLNNTPGNQNWVSQFQGLSMGS